MNGNDEAFSRRDWAIAVVIWLICVGFLSASLSCMRSRTCDHFDMVIFAICALSMMAPAWLGTVVARAMFNDQRTKPKESPRVQRVLESTRAKKSGGSVLSPAQPPAPLAAKPASIQGRVAAEAGLGGGKSRPERFCGHCRSLFTPNRKLFQRIRCPYCGLPA